MFFKNFFRKEPAIPSDVLKRLEDLESQFRVLKHEWVDMSDKLWHQSTRLYQRMRKRDQLETEKIEAEPAKVDIDSLNEDQLLQFARSRGYIR